MKSLWKLANAIHLGLYRLTSGRIGGRMGDGTILLLTTTGRKTGKARTVPVLYFLDDDGNPVVTASNAGLPKNPAWFENLRVNPRVTYQIGAERKIARADIAHPNCATGCGRGSQPISKGSWSTRRRPRGHTPSGFLIGAFGWRQLKKWPRASMLCGSRRLTIDVREERSPRDCRARLRRRRKTPFAAEVVGGRHSRVVARAE